MWIGLLCFSLSGYPVFLKFSNPHKTTKGINLVVGSEKMKPKTGIVNISEVEKTEMQKFIEDNSIDGKFIVMKDIMDKKITMKVIEMKHEIGDYKGKEIHNRHLKAEDGTIISLSGKAINNQVDEFFAKHQTPCTIEFMIVMTKTEDNEYREFIAKCLD